MRRRCSQVRADGPRRISYVEAARAAPASGPNLIPPLLAAVDGWAVVPPDIIVAMLAEQPDSSATRLLYQHERRLWRLVASGFSVEQIARELHVSDRTAKRLTAALLRRLNVRTRIEAATLTGRTGLLDAAGE